MNVVYRGAALDDITAKFRHYLVDLELPDIAYRFRESVKQTVAGICKRPTSAPLFQPTIVKLPGLRSWSVGGFEEVRVYFLWKANTLTVIRILHGKRNVRSILRRT